MEINIDLDLTPQTMCGPSTIKSVEDYKRDLEQQMKLVKTAFPYIEVHDLKAQLRFAMYTSVGVIKTSGFDETAVDLKEEDLIIAVEQQGSINIPAWYAINQAIRTALSQRLGAVKEIVESHF